MASDNAVGIIGRAGEGEADGNRLLVEFRDNLFESVDHGGEAEVEIMGIGRKSDRINDKFI